MPARQAQLSSVDYPRETLSRDEIATKLSTEQYSLLFQNMPLGIMEEDYSEVKKEIDKLIAGGVVDLAGYLRDNPETLQRITNTVCVMNVNKAALELRRADSVEALIRDEMNVDGWWNDDWVEFYANEFACLAQSEAFFGAELEDTRIDGSAYISRSSTFVVAGFEDTWARVVTIHEDITDRVQMEEQVCEARNLLERQVRERTRELRESEALLAHSHALYRQAEFMGNMGHWSWDHGEYRMISCSEQFARIYDTTVPEAIAYFSGFEAKMRLIHPEDRERYQRALRECDRTRRGLDIEYRIVTLSGFLRHIKLRSERVYDAGGTLLRSFGTVQDVSERIHTEQALLTQSQITSNMAEGAMLVRASDATIVYANPAFETMFGYAPGELLGEHISRIVATTDISSEKVTTNLIRELERHGAWRGEICNVKKDGSNLWCSANLSVFEHSEFGKVWISVNSDTTERRETEMKLSYQASHDILTGLINRREFEHRAERLISTTQRGNDEHALCFMDLDQFKVVNDSCGHTAGDKLLQQLGKALRNTVRQRDTLARLGGDEFGVLMEHCTLEQAHRTADALLEQVADFQFSWEGQSFRIGVSIGLVSITEATANLTELMKQADAACYMAKDQGRNRIQVYRPGDSELARRHGEIQWVTRIDQALAEERFTLFAQEIVALDDPAERRFELLLRLVDGEGEIIPPTAFLPAAERYDLIDKLDCWVVRHAFALMQENADFVEQVHMVSINLSGHSLSNQKFLESLIARIDEFGIDAGKLCFEITETAAISNLSMATTFIARLKELGCHFALDDFGSGLSSFAYLKNLAVDYLKIDGQFVKGMVDDPIDHAMVKSINDIGHVMGMKTIAEFVENDAIKAALEDIGINYVQGYGIEAPRPFLDVIKCAVSRHPVQ